MTVWNMQVSDFSTKLKLSLGKFSYQRLSPNISQISNYVQISAELILMFLHEVNEHFA